MSQTKGRKEKEKLKAFKSRHKNHKSLFFRKSGVKITKWNTGVGEVLNVYCNGCKRFEDISDYGSW